ncbi:MAG: hypothetical protein J7D61_07805 [Marichromatium sp.]|nr:hypothetical protein [Marichromatium sp.]
MRTSLLPLQRKVHYDTDGRIIGIERRQVIDDQLLANLHESRNKTTWKGEETLRIASVPLALVESLRQRGIDLMAMSAQEVVTTLRAAGMENFLAYGGRL